MKKFTKRFLKDEEGYGTVELLLIVAGIGLLAVTLFRGLQGSLVGTVEEGGKADENSTAGQVVTGIEGLVSEWGY